MSGVIARRRGISRLFACILATSALAAGPVRADTFDIQVDQAKIMKLPDRVATIVIGNPLIADAALQAGGILVITGKGYGSTNLLALDRNGRIIMDRTVTVLSPAGDGLVTVYKGTERESYSCSPECAPRITLGDTDKYFSATMAASAARTGGAAAGAQASGSAPAPR